MRNRTIVAAMLASFVLGSAAASATGQQSSALHRIASIEIPGAPLASFDIGFAAGGIYVLADRSNAAVDLVDTGSNKLIAQVKGFAGPVHGDRGGPNGVTIVDGRYVWAGDGNSSVKVIDIAARRIIAAVTTAGNRRVDELADDLRDHLVVAANGADRRPFITLISTHPPYAIAGKIEFPRATDGLEQPLWDPRTGYIYLSIPELDGVRARGGIAVIDPRKAKLIRIWRVTQCLPAGLALGPEQQLLVGCSDDAVAAGYPAKSILLDANSGRQIKTFNQVGGSDEIWYDQTLRSYLLAAVANPGGAVLGVVAADRSRWLENVPSGKNAHSVAADPRNGDVFVPVAAGDANCPRGCVEVFGR